MTDEFPIRVEQRGGVAVWTIDRPDRMNALSRATLLALGRLAREAVDERVDARRSSSPARATRPSAPART